MTPDEIELVRLVVYISLFIWCWYKGFPMVKRWWKKKLDDRLNEYIKEKEKDHPENSK